MSQTIKRWGNSLALRIPAAYAGQLHWSEDTQVELHVIDGKLVADAVAGPAYTLEQLVDGITPRNLHQETGTGQAVGNEVW